jgi:hypothetical protein
MTSSIYYTAKITAIDTTSAIANVGAVLDAAAMTQLIPLAAFRRIVSLTLSFVAQNWE